MFLFNMIFAAALAPAAHPSPTFPLLACTELTEAHRFINVTSSIDAGLLAALDGHTGPISGTLTDGTFAFQNGSWDDAHFLSLEIKRVNGRYIGVMYEPSPAGAVTRYTESVFQCAEIVAGSASSSGG